MPAIHRPKQEISLAGWDDCLYAHQGLIISQPGLNTQGASTNRTCNTAARYSSAGGGGVQ